MTSAYLRPPAHSNCVGWHPAAIGGDKKTSLDPHRHQSHGHAGANAPRITSRPPAAAM